MRLAHCLLVALLLVPVTAAAQMQIRTYSVPIEHQETIETVLGEAISVALSPPGARQQRTLGVSSPGRGQILVTAPPHIHEDIERFLRDFEPVEISNLKTEYWILEEEPDGNGELPADLEPIADVLGSLELKASRVEYVQILSESGGGSAEASINGGSIQQRLSYIGDKISGELSLRYKGGQLQTQMALIPGQYIVLGRISTDNPGIEDEKIVYDPITVLFIVRSDLAD